MKKIMVANGTYQKDGQTKTNWVEIGIINMGKNGKEYCLLNPVISLAGFPREPGKDRLIASIFEDDREANPRTDTSNYKEQPKAVVPNTDIPLVLESQEIPF